MSRPWKVLAVAHDSTFRNMWVSSHATKASAERAAAVKQSDFRYATLRVVKRPPR